QGGRAGNCSSQLQRGSNCTLTLARNDLSCPIQKIYARHFAHNGMAHALTFRATCGSTRPCHNEPDGMSLDLSLRRFLFAVDDRWLPKSVLCLRNYNLNKFIRDLIAGITVGLVALPLAMAFSIASGLTPQAGIYCAVVTGFLISALGGSKFQIGGPTGAFVVVVYGIVAKHGVDGLHLCTLLAGIMLAILGLTGMGSAVKFIPRPVVIGFTNGIALLIASTQLKDFFGIAVDNVPGEFVARLRVLAANASHFSPQATALAAGTLAAIVLAMRFLPRVPGA